MRRLHEWPRPKPDYGLGLHSSADCYSARWAGRDNAVRDRDIDVLKAMHMTWLKLLVDGLNQLDAARAFVKAGFAVIIRPYKPPITDSTPPADQLKAYADVGCSYAESYQNEPEIEWGLPASAANIERLARMHIRHADTCAHAGILPVTPSIQGDRFGNWFRPLCKKIVELGRQDALEGSAIGGHWRPGSYKRGNSLFPPSSPPIDETHGGVGFVFRSYEVWDAFLRDLLGGPLPMLGTEAGYEPSEVNGDLGLHAALNVELASMAWSDSLFCQCFWIGVPGGMGDASAWIANPYHGVLPVVPAFEQALVSVRWQGVPEPEPPDIFPPENVEAMIRRWCFDHAYPGPIPYFADAAFQKGQNLGAPVTVEHKDGGYSWQGFALGIKYCRVGEYNNIDVLSWTAT